MGRWRSEWRWEGKEGKGREWALRMSGQRLTRGTVSTVYVPVRGSRVLSAPVAMNKVCWKFVFFFPNILSRIIAKPADLI
jgi:hypothetical protein